MKKYPGNTILLRVTPDRYGNWDVQVVSAEHNRKITEYLKQFNVKWDGVYLQVDWERNDFVELTNMYKGKVKDLDDGWPVKVTIDKWTFPQSGLVGYDAGDANILG